MGVVTDLGANDRITFFDAPMPFAIKTTDTTPATQPANCETMIATACFLILPNCWYKGSPNATTAGFRKNSMILDPS